MKTKKLCALVLSLMLVFSCFAVIPFTSITAAAATSTAKMIHVDNGSAKAGYLTYTWRPLEETDVVKPSTNYRVSFYWENISNASIDTSRMFEASYYNGSSWQLLFRANDMTAGAATGKSISKTAVNHGDRVNIDFTTPADCQNGASINFYFGDIAWAFQGSRMIFNLADIKLYTRDGSNNLTEVPTTDIGANTTVGTFDSSALNGNTAGQIFERGGSYPRPGYLTFLNITEGYFDGLYSETAATPAVYIGKCAEGSNQAGTVFIPLTSKYSGSYQLQDKCTVEFTCKVKVLSGTKPMVGFMRTTDYPDSTKNQSRTVTATNWIDNSTAAILTGDTLTVRFKLDDIPADRNCYKSETRWYNKDTKEYPPVVTTGEGGIWGGLTIGNVSFNAAWTQNTDWNGSYIISEPSLKAVLDKDGNSVTATSGEMLAGFDQCNTVGIYGLAGKLVVGIGTDAMNHPWRAPANKWSIMGNNPDLVKFVTVDDSYTVANRTYVQHAETTTTREYYTCTDFEDVKFEKFGTGCYSVIDNDINKKAVIIGDDGSGKVANIYLPLYTHRYFQSVGKDGVSSGGWRDGYSNGTAGGNVFYHISFNAKRLSGTGRPVLGRMYAANWGNHDSQFRVGTNAAYNGSGDATARPTGDNSVVNSTYDPSTGEFTAVVRFNKGYFYQLCQSGYNEILTIGNVEHTGTTGTYDTDCRGSSFAISDISIQVYDANNTTLLDSEAAPEMVAGNYWFDPDPDTIDDHTSQHYYEEGTSSHNGRPTALYNMPIDTWGCDGSQAMISVVDLSACLANHHELTYHAADPANGTREYWGCATCRTCYADPYGNEDIGNDISATNKMIVLKGSGSKCSNALLPLAMNSSAGTHYYKFTCDMKVFGDEIPTLSVVQGSWWGGNGALSTDGWTNHSDEPNASGFYTYYDAETGKYEAVFKIEHSSSSLAYSNALTGAYAGLLLGNARHVGSGGLTDASYFTTFAFTNPELYQLSDGYADEESNDYQDTTPVSANLAAPITDKTLNFGSAYSALPAQRYSGEWTMYAANNLLAAPLGKWSVDTSRSWIKATDIPEDFFSTSADPDNYMIAFGGTSSTFNYIIRQVFLEPGATYQFDIDYRESGSTARIALETAYPSSYASPTLTTTEDDVPGAHKSVRFTMHPTAQTGSGDGNFRLNLGQCVPSGIQKQTASVYFANASLRKVVDGELGENLFINGSFEFGSEGTLTAEDYLDKIFGWESYSSGEGTPCVLIPARHKLMTIPENFFDGVLGQNITDKAVKIVGQDWLYLRASIELEADTTYRLTYNYRAEEDLPNFAVTARGSSNPGTYTVTNNYMKNNGKFEASYNIQTSANLASNSNADANTWLDFRYGAGVGSDAALYLGNICLQKLVGGVPTGSNILGDYNPVYDDSCYPEDYNETTFSGDTAAAASRDFVHGWLSSKSSSTGAVVKIDENFFNYYTGSQQLTLMQKKLLGITDSTYNPYNDEINPYGETNGDGVYNILDLIRLKKTAAITDEGGAGYEANELKNKIRNAGNIGTAPSGKKTYYVSNSGSDSNNGTSTSTPYATISKAISKATSGDYILLKRGDTWRNPGAASNYEIPTGVTVGSYGTGNKPLIIGSQKNYAGSSNWTNISGNIWRTKIPGEIHDQSIPGTVYFFNNANDEPSLIGRIIKQTNTSSGKGDRFASYSELEQEGDVYYATGRPDFTGYVYVYSVGNPGSKYSRIEIPEKSGVFDLSNNCTVDNIEIKYVGGHAIVSTSESNLTITNCEIGYVGGTPNSSETMGNGIQFGLGGSNLRVENCYVYQCFDAGLTFQSWGTSNTTFDNVTFKDNLLTNNFYNIEFWTTGSSTNKSSGGASTPDGTMRNIYITGNIMRFAGECFSYKQRQDTELRAANIMVTTGAYYVNTSNLNITDNIFDCTMVSHITWFWQNLAAHADKQTHVGVTISGNTYYQKAGSRDGRVNRWRGNDTYDYAGSTSTLATAINKMDTAPKMIQWVNRADRV